MPTHNYLMTTYEQSDAGMVAVEHYTANVTSGKHGTNVFTYEGAREFFVEVYDNTEDGIDLETAKAIADHAKDANIYWSDYRLCHWMFDFRVGDHWCEGLFHNNGLPEDAPSLWEHLHINVYT